MRSSVVRLCGCLVIAAVPASGFANELPTVKMLPVRLAFEAAQAAIDACAAQGFRVSASFVSHDGATKLIAAGDGAGPVATITSRLKAYTAGTIGITSGKLGDTVAKLPGGAFPPIDGTINIMTYAGGVPIVSGKDVLGGLGVGGSDDPAVDEACAKAGLAKIKDSLD